MEQKVYEKPLLTVIERTASKSKDARYHYRFAVKASNAQQKLGFGKSPVLHDWMNQAYPVGSQFKSDAVTAYSKVVEVAKGVNKPILIIDDAGDIERVSKKK